LFLAAAISFSAAILAALWRVRLRPLHVAAKGKDEIRTAARLELIASRLFFLSTALGLGLALYGAGVQVKSSGKQNSAPPAIEFGR
jgi:hypothetical protein